MFSGAHVSVTIIARKDTITHKIQYYWNKRSGLVYLIFLLQHWSNLKRTAKTLACHTCLCPWSISMSSNSGL